MDKETKKKLEKILVEERCRFGELHETKEIRDLHEYYKGYEHAYIYFEKLFILAGRQDGASFLKKYLP